METISTKSAVNVPLAIPFHRLLKRLNDDVPEVYFQPISSLASFVIINEPGPTKRIEAVKEAQSFPWRPIDAESRIDAVLILDKDGDNYKNSILVRICEKPSERVMIKVYKAFSNLQEEYDVDIFFQQKPDKQEQMVDFRGSQIPASKLKELKEKNPELVEYEFKDENYSSGYASRNLSHVFHII